MNFSAEDIARDLYGELMRRFGEMSPTLEGQGLHWHCTAGRDDRDCRIHCHTMRDDCEYFTAFRQSCDVVAWSRISSRDDTLDAVADWLDGVDIPHMYERYRFVDAGKRKLSQIRDDVFAAEPDLPPLCETELRQHAADIYSLYFRGSDRSCRVSYYGRNEWPDARFLWSGRQLLEYQPQDNTQLAAVLNAWIGETLAPSAMRRRFPWLTIGPVADYYEAGQPYEGECVMSWDAIEEFFDDERLPWADDVKQLVSAMRTHGYDRTLRAGQSLWSLVLSRSRRHGLRIDQPCIAFRFHRSGMTVSNALEDRRNPITTEHAEIQLTADVDTLLKQLEARPVD
ncbi:hypothetical protein Mal4_56570 [Maioricimonas rarisocia]|uniref:Uncharacterized protein n=1 Tax=Maioricimonas rarisocia TaxID=2528026 RepID=A0A517ZFQ8_9PLAN|nr:hypothetical protein [Maioricimonas rarisocia]QDU41291.1 hypothetical protein Mal4_56570 [Maioricimonas rarisocia]